MSHWGTSQYWTIHKRRRQFFRIFDTSLLHIGSFLVLSIGNFDQFLTPPNCRRRLWTAPDRWARLLVLLKIRGFVRVRKNGCWVFMEFFHSPNYFFLLLLKITFSLKIGGAIAPIAPILPRPLLIIVQKLLLITGASMIGWQSRQLPTQI